MSSMSDTVTHESHPVSCLELRNLLLGICRKQKQGRKKANLPREGYASPCLLKFSGYLINGIHQFLV